MEKLKEKNIQNTIWYMKQQCGRLVEISNTAAIKK